MNYPMKLRGHRCLRAAKASFLLLCITGSAAVILLLGEPTYDGHQQQTARRALPLVQQLFDGVYLVHGARVREVFRARAITSRGGRSVPTSKEGCSTGFKIFSIRPGSVYHQLGLRNGDVIQAINGMPLTSPEAALQVHATLRSAHRVTVSLSRRGQKRVKLYILG